MMKKFTFIVWILVLCQLQQATAQLTLRAELRPRAEFRDGYKSPNTQNNRPASLVSQRSRAALLFRHDRLQTGISFQDVRVWGDESLASATGIFGDNASVDVNEAWIKLNFLHRSAVKIGRQYFDYDDGRLLANRNWNQHSVSYDAILYQFAGDDCTLDAAFSYNNEKETNFYNSYPPNRLRTLNFVHTGWHNEALSLAAIALLTGVESEASAYTLYARGSYGLNINIEKEAYGVSCSGYFQHGRNGTGIPVKAWNLNLLAGVKVGTINVTAGFTTLSGNHTKPGDTTLTTDHMFDLFYGARHRYYGEMDYFSNLSQATGGRGLNDIFLKIEFRAGATTSLYATVHYFANQYPFFNPETAERCNLKLATELDLGININISKEVNLKGGTAFLDPSHTLAVINGAGDDVLPLSSWAWLQLTVTPSVIFDK